MRLNKFISNSSEFSRRSADTLISDGRVTVNGEEAVIGTEVSASDVVKIDGRVIKPSPTFLVLLNKPVGYVCSRNGQGNPTVYDLLPDNYQNLKTIGRLDKDSSGLLLFTNDGGLANQLTHPSFQKEKLYEVGLDKALSSADLDRVKHGIMLFDGISKLKIEPSALKPQTYNLTLTEGRNRQIRRTFDEIGYQVRKLHRTKFGKYVLTSNLKNGEFSEVKVL